MATYATVDDLRDRYEGDIPESLEEKLTVRIEEAELIVARPMRGNIAAWIAAGKTSAAEVKMVLCNMVLRVLRNPGGTTVQSAGPFAQTLDKAVASGKLFLTRDDRRALGLRRGPTSIEMKDDALARPLRPPTQDWCERSNFSPEYYDPDWP